MNTRGTAAVGATARRDSGVVILRAYVFVIALAGSSYVAWWVPTYRTSPMLLGPALFASAVCWLLWSRPVGFLLSIFAGSLLLGTIGGAGASPARCC